ncbi:MAG: hypothetical protein ACRD3D_01965 [Terriglobia bacterium]
MNRKQFLALAAGGAAAAWTAQGNAQARAQGELVQTSSEWNPDRFRSVAARPGRYKQVYDITVIGGGVFLNNVKNSLNGLQFGFGIKPRQMNILVALHGGANLLNFDDAMWAKYKLGEYAGVADPESHAPAARNIFYPQSRGPLSTEIENDHSTYQDHSIQGLMKRGVSFLLCHTATEEQSRKLKARLRLTASPESIARDLLAHTIPGAIVVPSMVAAVALLQIEYQFSYITVA